MEPTKIVVVGAGVAGLSAALHLQAAGCDVTVLERQTRAGGLIETERHGDFIVEHGPDGFLASKGDVMGELATLDLLDEVVTGGPAPRRAFVANGSGLTPLPAGLFRFERKSMFGLLGSPLLSPSAKMRLFAEPFVTASGSADEEDVAAFFARRLGSEVADHVVSPMLRGIYGSPASELGMRATMPKLAAMERKFGSLGVALLSSPRGAPGVGLATLKLGMGSLVDRMTSRLHDLRLGVSVEQMVAGPKGKISIRATGQDLVADGVVLACPSYAAARLVPASNVSLGECFASIGYKRADSISLAYDVRDCPTELDGTGFVLDPELGGDIVACTWSSRKWPGRAPSESLLFRCVAQAPGTSDMELVASVRRMLARTLGVSQSPTMVRLRRRACALPTYAVGHEETVATLRRQTRALGRIELAGNAYDGVGVPDCIASGRAAAEAVLA